MEPDTKTWDDFKKRRNGKLSCSHYGDFEELSRDHDCFEVRLYNHMPSFRMQFVDAQYVAIARYKIEEEEYVASEYGLKAPHLVVQNEMANKYQWSLYGAFESLYNYIWQTAKPLKGFIH